MKEHRFTREIITGSPINEKIIDDHLAVQAIIRSYQVKDVL